MGLLQKAENKMAYGKVGMLGFQGSGKTYTASLIAIGICEMIGVRKVAFFDTETGSDFVIPVLTKAGFKRDDIFVHKGRAFSDLLEVIKEAEDAKIPVLIIDSITHVWRDLCQSYDKKLKRKGRLQFQDWAMVKGEWGGYTDSFVNSKVHIIVCGRAGYEYDYDFNEDGTKDLVKTGTKMKVENEFGFEPSLVIEMERISENRAQVEEIKGNKKKKEAFKPKVGSKWIHRAHILKDRTDSINGQAFDYPTFDNFQPHFACLNIGGEHFGVDTTRDSTDRFDDAGRPAWQKEKQEKEIILEEIQNFITQIWPGTTKEEKTAKADLVELLFERRSWKHVETNIPLQDLKDACELLDHFRVRYRELQEDKQFLELDSKEQIEYAIRVSRAELKEIAETEQGEEDFPI